MDLLFQFSSILLSTSVWFYLLRRKDLFSPEPLLFLAKIMILGGILSAIPAGILNSLIINNFQSNLVINNLLIGFNEELCKLLVVTILLKNQHYFDEPVDGIIYAATLALGFASIENIVYINRYGIESLLPRHFISVPAHLSFAMLWGYGLSVAKFKHPTRSFTLSLAPYFLSAATLHALFNFTIGLQPKQTDLVIVIILVTILYRYGSYQANTLLKYSPLRLAKECPACNAINTNTTICHQCKKQISI